MPGLRSLFCIFLHEYGQEFQGSMGKENNLIVLVVGCPFLHINSNSVTVVWYGGGGSSKYSN